MEQFEFEKAEKMFQKASEADPEDASIFVHRALLHVNSKLDFEKAKELISESIFNPTLLIIVIIMIINFLSFSR